MFDRHVPAKYADRAPRLVRDVDGLEKWVFQGTTVGVMGLNSVVSWPKEQWGMDPSTLSEMRPGSYDIHERIRDMNRNGVLASMCFPTFAGFSGRTFQEAAESGDPEVALVMLQAYNDWHIDEWCAAYPGRFIPLAIPPGLGPPGPGGRGPTGSPAKGCRAISMPELPHLLGLPTYQSDYWDPFFTALCDEGVIMCLHIGGGFRRSQAGRRLVQRPLHGAGHPGLHALGPGPHVGTGATQVLGAEDRLVRRRDRLDPVPPRPLRPALPEPEVDRPGLR